MKKAMILAAFAALLSLASCQKNEPAGIGPEINIGADNSSPVFSAIINPGTTTAIDVSNGKVSWEASDEITVTDAASNSAVYVIESIDATTGKATFVIKEGENALGDGPYSAVYGTPPAKEQSYSATAGRLYMTAPATSDNSFTFTVQCGMMKLNLTSPDESVKRIAVTGTPIDGSETTYNLTCDGESIDEAKDFFIALSAGTYTEIAITNGKEKTCTLKGGVDIAANHIKPVTLGEDKVKFEQDKPDGKLPGKFTINEYGDQVYFSQGNLYYDGADFRFEDHQYDFNDEWLDTYISHFYWSSDPDVAIAEEYNDSSASDSDIFFTNEDETTANSEFTVHIGEDDEEGQQGVWRTLSTDEWQYLFTTRTNSSSLFKTGVTVCGKSNCVIIAPDGSTVTIAASYDATTWPVAEAAGLV